MLGLLISSSQTETLQDTAHLSRYLSLIFKVNLCSATLKKKN